MDFKKLAAENERKYVKPYVHAENEIDFINTMKFQSIPGDPSKIIKVYEYQENFILNLNKYDFNVVVKARQCGYTTMYALHMIYNLFCYFFSDKDGKDDIPPTYFCVSTSGAAAEELKRKVEYFASKICSKDFLLFVKKQVTYASQGNYIPKLCGKVITEALLDEAVFFDNPFEVLYNVSAYTNRVTMMTSYGDEKDEEKFQDLLKKLFERLYKDKKDSYSYTETHWWECPKYNKNLMWMKVEAEPIIDKEGNVAYNKEAWDKRIKEGWIATSKDIEILGGMGIKDNELLN